MTSLCCLGGCCWRCHHFPPLPWWLLLEVRCHDFLLLPWWLLLAVRCHDFPLLPWWLLLEVRCHDFPAALVVVAGGAVP